MNILVDDKRDSENGIICRDIECAKLVLESIGSSINYSLYLDHDLGKGEGQEGIDLLKWLFDCNQVGNDFLPSVVILVSENVSGLKNMRDLLVYDLKYTADLSGRVFTR